MNWRDSIWVQDSVTRRRSQSVLKLCSVKLPMKENCNLSNISGIPIKTTVTYLGVIICKDEKMRNDLNFDPIIRKNRFNMWLQRDLSLQGRVLLSKVEGNSRSVYVCLCNGCMPVRAVCKPHSPDLKRGALATDTRGCSLWRSLLERPPPAWESRVRDPLGVMVRTRVGGVTLIT